MCTVVCRCSEGEPLQILALRDEFTGRDFDDPGAWWRDHPGAVGGRDRLAGGSWCVSDVDTATTALVLNRSERRDGTPSRGLLPLAALSRGDRWAEAVPVETMASFNLVLARPGSASVWAWDGKALTRQDVDGGTHFVTSRGVDTDDAKTQRFAPQFAAGNWLEVVARQTPAADSSALVVRHEIGDRVYATVFGQLITAVPGALRVEHSRTPWVAGSWVERQWPTPDGP